MLSFREQLIGLKEKAIQNKGKRGKECEKDVKTVANQILKDVLDMLQEKSCTIIADVQGIAIRLISETSICIDYIDGKNFSSVSLAVYPYDTKKYTLQIFKAIRSILSKEKLRISDNDNAFEAFL